MGIRRVPIQTVADPEHEAIQLEGRDTEILPFDRYYVKPETGISKSGQENHCLRDLDGDEVEIPRTTWYAKELDPERLRSEMHQMLSIPRLCTFKLFRKSGEPENFWDSYYWRGKAPTGHIIKACYSSYYPSEPIKVFERPQVSTHHRHKRDNRLCLHFDQEWRAEYTAASIILITFRFLDEFFDGKTEGSHAAY